MDALYNLKDRLEKEITKFNDKGDVSPTDLKTIGEAVDILKDIETICAMKEYGDDDQSYAMPNRGYSMDRYESRRPDWDNRGMYYDNNSYKRDSMGRYSRHSEKEEMIEKLERKLKSAQTEQERRYIMECIDELERN